MKPRPTPGVGQAAARESFGFGIALRGALEGPIDK
jgi:hypothetical protein